MEIHELLERRVARFTDRVADWDAFADARVAGFRRAQHRFIGAGASGKGDPKAIPAEHFTLSIMYAPPGQGNAPHTHPVEEAFFILEGKVKVFIEDGKGGRAETVLGKWDFAWLPLENCRSRRRSSRCSTISRTRWICAVSFRAA